MFISYFEFYDLLMSKLSWADVLMFLYMPHCIVAALNMCLWSCKERYPLLFSNLFMWWVVMIGGQCYDTWFTYTCVGFFVVMALVMFLFTWYHGLLLYVIMCVDLLVLFNIHFILVWVLCFVLRSYCRLTGIRWYWDYISEKYGYSFFIKEYKKLMGVVFWGLVDESYSFNEWFPVFGWHIMLIIWMCFALFTTAFATLKIIFVMLSFVM